MKNNCRFFARNQTKYTLGVEFRMLQAQSNKIVSIHSVLCVSKHRVISALFDKIETQEDCREHPPPPPHVCVEVKTAHSQNALVSLHISLSDELPLQLCNKIICVVLSCYPLSPILSRSSDQKYWSWERSCCQPSAHRQGSLEESSTWGGEFHLRSSNFD